MDKQAALDALWAATSAHLKWRVYAQALIAGVEVSEDKIPVSHADCAFGKWYYGEGRRQLGHLASFRDLEVPHQILHAVYRKIFETLHGAEHRSFLGKKFGGKAAHRAQERERARAQMQVQMQALIDISETLLRAIRLVADEVLTLPD